MRCEHCGRNEATFHYQSVVNGRRQETHLCPRCAAELGYDTGFNDAFDSVFSALPNMLGGFEEFFGGPQLTSAARRTLQLSPAPDQPVYETESLLDEAEGSALRRECARNALTLRLKQAVDAERYEEAAQLRDELKKLEEERSE